MIFAARAASLRSPAARAFSTAAARVQTIGFIGLGQMGFPMAHNLLNRYGPSKIVVNDVASEATERFLAEHPGKVVIAKSPAEVAEHSDAIVTMLPTPPLVRGVYLGKNGIAEGMRKGAILIDSSTIDPATSRALADALQPKGATVVDAPVSGGTMGAVNGTLTFMVGGDDEAVFERVKPILQGMGKNIVYCGKHGSGQVAKICNNMLLGITMIGASEAMNLGARLGMDPKLLAGILNTSTGRCWSTDTCNPYPGVMEGVPASRNYDGGFGVSLIAKDLGLAVAAANEAKSTVILGGIAHQIYNQLSTTPGYEKKDFSSVFKWLNDNGKRF